MSSCSSRLRQPCSTPIPAPEAGGVLAQGRAVAAGLHRHQPHRVVLERHHEAQPVAAAADAGQHPLGARALCSSIWALASSPMTR